MTDPLTAKLAAGLTDEDIRMICTVVLMRRKGYASNDVLDPIYTRLTTPPDPDPLDAPVTGEDIVIVGDGSHSDIRVGRFCWWAHEGWSTERATYFLHEPDALAQAQRLRDRGELPKNADGTVMSRREAGVTA